MFQVIRLTRGAHKGKVFVLPLKKSGLRVRNGVDCAPLCMRAQNLASGLTYGEAYWYAVGLLQGETGKSMSPYVLRGRAKAWKEMKR